MYFYTSPECPTIICPLYLMLTTGLNTAIVNGLHKVLIVENNPTVIKLISHFFQSEGCRIRLAHDGLQAMSVLDSFIPDILFTDIIMPKISGDELCRFVRQTPRLKDIFIVIYSAIVCEDEKQIIDLGADLYIAKGARCTIKSHISHVLDRFRSGKRKDNIIYGMEDLFPRGITTELLLSRQHYHTILENLAEAIIEMDSSGQIIQINKAARELLGSDLATLLSSRLTDHLAGPGIDLIEQWFTLISTEKLPPFQSSYGSPLLAGKHQVVLKLVRVAEKNEFFIIAIVQDVTSHKIMEGEFVTKINEFNAVMESIRYGVLFTDSNLKCRIANRAFRDMWGIPDELFARCPTIRELIKFNRHNGIYDIPEEKFDSYLDKREKAIRDGGGVSEEFLRKDGIVYQYQCVILPDGGRMLTYFDITKHKNSQAQLAKDLEKVQGLANRDPLTGLPNLRLLKERFFNILSMTKRKGWKAAILFIDIDGFKEVNDTYGHMVGDIILKMVAARLLKIIRESDTVARIGGDEFLIIQTEVNDKETIAFVADKILNKLADPFDLAGTEIKIGASIGIAIYPEHGNNIQLLIKKADKAMYKAKKLGKGTYTFTPD